MKLWDSIQLVDIAEIKNTFHISYIKSLINFSDFFLLKYLDISGKNIIFVIDNIKNNYYFY